MKTIIAIASITLLLAACGEARADTLRGQPCQSIAQDGCMPSSSSDTKLVAQAPDER